MEASAVETANEAARDARQAGLAAASVIAELSRREDAAPASAWRSDLWRAAEQDLAPVIGQRGVAAVLGRTLCTARRTHAWLPDLPGEAAFEDCMQALAQAFSGQWAGEAATASRALEETFHGQLSSLVGAALTTELLRTAWCHRTTGPGK